MYLKTLHLRQFRNYRDQQVEFFAPKTILLGDNAQGKSNLLEAVELLATLRSHRATRDRELVQEGEAIGQIAATLEKDTGLTDLAIALRANGRRTVALNGETLRRQLDFLGVMNAVQFSSLDLDLVRGGPGQRRSWLDALLTQLEPVYAYILQQYNHVLRQRNAFLKQQRKDGDRPVPVSFVDEAVPAVELLAESAGSEAMPPDATQLAIWDAQLAAIGSRVIRRRARVIERLAPIAQFWHQAISDNKELLEVNYAPNVGLEQDNPAVVQQAFLAKIQQRAIAEHYQGTSLVGPHRDEVEFTINQTPARQYGSQGQQRTLVLSLKLAELKLIESVVGEAPLLLLDDVLAELDLNRQNKLLETIQDRFQTLITTTHLGSFDAQWLKSSQILTVEAGKIRPS
ncbi:DNA replication/repair protein RecF [Leptolyngbya sp. FACHB-541]|uniref:DNA replication/repair protein RecF n=1 Tax=Leptolyngbya sp. FACHB-541 TaxID=2692810 RepID=UPI00168673A6|nr:DNA replication/repair protein RecF [Leptolyngbya sp. FACHB-541]MBD1996390.1 DNA replication/repair protein RecF [Leptolyngbya sp. FACHB-541]